MGLIVLLAIGGAIAGYIRRNEVCCFCVYAYVHIVVECIQKELFCQSTPEMLLSY